MRILLLGEYSNVHATLAQGLRALGHTVVVASNGDWWKNYPRDIDLQRKGGFWGKIAFTLRLIKALPQMRGFDIVQLINPMFLELKAESLTKVYRYLRRHNRKVVLGAYGMDYYWVQVNSEIRPMKYSDFNFGDQIRHDAPAERERQDWVHTAKESLNRYIATDCDAIVAGLYEYLVTYQHAEGSQLKDKVSYIPFPLSSFNSQLSTFNFQLSTVNSQLKIFIGISRGRSSYKGTDIMLSAAQALQQQYPDRVELLVAEGVPFQQYQQMLEGSDLILDQLYSYTPAMNSLLAMSKGIINVGGGEEEHYALLNEHELRPIINVEPNYQSVYNQLEQLVLHPERIPELKRQSIEYVRRHHDHIKVAQQYADLYTQILSQP